MDLSNNKYEDLNTSFEVKIFEKDKLKMLSERDKNQNRVNILG